MDSKTTGDGMVGVMSGFLVSMAGGDLRGWAMGEDDDELEWGT